MNTRTPRRRGSVRNNTARRSSAAQMQGEPGALSCPPSAAAVTASGRRWGYCRWRRRGRWREIPRWHRFAIQTGAHEGPCTGRWPPVTALGSPDPRPVPNPASQAFVGDKVCGPAVSQPRLSNLPWTWVVGAATAGSCSQSLLPVVVVLPGLMPLISRPSHAALVLLTDL